ncbi:MAG: ATP-binding protein [Calditrichia bacterium]
MPTRLADRIHLERRRRFIGRLPEKTLFLEAVSAPQLPFHVLYVYGAGGIGKTQLFREFMDICQLAEAVPVYIDGRNIEPSTDAFLNCMGNAMRCPDEESPLTRLSAAPRRHVLFIDIFELLSPLDRWLRESFLPQLSENILVVLGSHLSASPGWNADPGWQDMIKIIKLKNFSEEESRAYLSERKVPMENYRRILEFSHGHPLALSLISDLFDQRPDLRFEPEEAPNVIQTLLALFIQKVPGPAHRTALEASSLVGTVTESLLGHLLGFEDVHEIFAWLRNLSFFESNRRGIFPHDLAREALVTDLKWRNPDWYKELHRRARLYFSEKIKESQGEEQRRLLFDLIFLHRDNSIVRPFFNWQESGTILTDEIKERDWPALEKMIVMHEGTESFRWFRFWHEKQPRTSRILRNADQAPCGLITMLDLSRANTAGLEADPATRAILHYLQDKAPLRPGERALFFRFWMASNTYQSVSPTQSQIFVNIIQYYFTTPSLAYSFFPCADPDFWEPILVYADLKRIPEADYKIGDNSYGVFGHDWRVVPPSTWINLLAEREIETDPLAIAPEPAEPLLVLRREDFDNAVKDAFRYYTEPSRLQNNPLLRSRLIAGMANSNVEDQDRLDSLIEAVRSATDSLQDSPRDEKLYRILYRTYLNPAISQEQAAEALGLPFSTYRRHLKAAILKVADKLWQREINGKVG